MSIYHQFVPSNPQVFTPVHVHPSGLTCDRHIEIIESIIHRSSHYFHLSQLFYAQLDAIKTDNSMGFSGSIISNSLLHYVDNLDVRHCVYQFHSQYHAVAVTSQYTGNWTGTFSAMTCASDILSDLASHRNAIFISAYRHFFDQVLSEIKLMPAVSESLDGLFAAQWISCRFAIVQTGPHRYTLDGELLFSFHAE